MVSQFPLDPMHLIDLGISKKLLILLLSDLNKITEKTLSEVYEAYTKYIPREFTRSTRSFKDIPRWKATEFRFFILYGCLALFKNKINDEKFYHICLLTTSLRLLSQTNCQENIEAAQKCINEFVELYPRFCGLKNVGYNIHSLLHFPKYVALYGEIDNFSGYKYENYMQEIKKMIKSPVNILQQISNKILDQQFLKEHLKDDSCMKTRNMKIIEFDRFLLEGNKKDCCCAVSIGATQVPFIISSFTMINKEKMMVGRRFLSVAPFFERPINSAHIGIIEVADLAEANENIAVSNILFKYCRLPVTANTWLLIKMLHETEKVRFI